MEPASITWPARFDPARAPVHVRNELSISGLPEAVWACLIRAADWPSWYPNASRVRIGDGTAQDLSADARFTWRTFGVSLRSQVDEFAPRKRIAWSAVGLGVDVYHAWLIEPSEGGCRVLTEETQFGWACRLGNLLMPGRMYHGHQLWLERLASRALGSGSVTS